MTPAPLFYRSCLLLSLIVLLWSCSDATPPEPSAPSKTAGAAPDLLLAVHPYDTPSRLVARFQPLSDYLSERLGKTVGLYIATSYEDQIARMAEGRADLAYMGPSPYLCALSRDANTQRANLRLVAGEMMQGQISYRSVIITRRSSPVHALTDLKGRTMAFGAKQSYSHSPATMCRRRCCSRLVSSSLT